MTYLKPLFLLFVISLTTVGCSKDHDDDLIRASEINDFVWKGMTIFYLYQSEIPNLSDDRFKTNQDYIAYINSYADPFDLFESLIYERQTIDRFSWMVDDYIALEQQFQGTARINGMEFSLFLAPNSSYSLYGMVRLVLPNTSAELQGVKRGDLFYGIDGETLNTDNYLTLLNQNSYSINLGLFDDQETLESTDDIISQTGETIELTKTVYTENPIYKDTIFDVGSEQVAYLMYNGFTAGSEAELNSIFGNFKAQNVQHLILDLRYNPGGRISVETSLASMITGQFTGDIFAKLIYNDNFQEQNTAYKFQNQLQNGATINSLNLNKIYVLTTNRTASASEGLINGLAPYNVEVIQIGTNTTGKTQASITLYDSPNFEKQNINPSHTYAMQPLVANGVNKNNEAVPGTGLQPTVGFEYEENPFYSGVLGDINEPMLALALANIANETSKIDKITSGKKVDLKLFIDSNDLNTFKGGMTID